MNKREDNLRPCEYKFSKEEQSRGGKKSAEVRKERKTFRDEVLIMLESVIGNKNGEDITGRKGIVVKAFKDALNGDAKAREFILELSGEKPAEKIIVSEVSQDTIDEIEKMINDDES